jgi:opacity protein-like surface antigen
MANLKALMLAGGALIALSPAAVAADLLPPAPALEPPSPAAAEFSGWYLRGDVGIGANVNTPGIVQTPDVLSSSIWGGWYDSAATETSYNNSISAAGIFDLGVGYQFNNWLRFDVTGEYRGGSRMHSMYVINDPMGKNQTQAADFYSGDLSSIIGLFNTYVDLGTWYGVTPYVGAGLGFALNTLSGLSDQSYNYTSKNGETESGGYASDKSKWNFAWALMAGFDYNVTQNLKLELGYRYLDVGKYASGEMACLNGSGGSFYSLPDPNCEPAIKSKGDLAYNDFRLGLRWTFGEEASYAPAPLMRKY